MGPIFRFTPEFTPERGLLMNQFNYFSNPELRGHKHVSFVTDEASGLKAIIAIHDTSMGDVAGGGIRMKPYENDELALKDALRLSRGMTYKNALAALPAGGAKTVVIGDPATEKTPELLTALARAINTLGGNYVAGQDVGTNSEDMAIMARTTNFVAAGSDDDASSVDGNAYTALGVYLAMRVAVRAKLGRENLSGVSVALQGVGKVAYKLASLLVKEGAEVYATDVNKQALNAAVENLGVKPVAVEEIAYLDVDVFSPCALGGILNSTSIPKLRASIVCGAANNQLATDADDELIHSHDILYMPDYLVNAGGVICGFAMVQGINDADKLTEMVGRISPTAEQVVHISQQKNVGMQAAADELAEKILSDARNKK